MLKNAEGDALTSRQNASSSQTSPHKVSQTTIQNNDQEQEQKSLTSRSNATANTKNNSQILISEIDAGIVQQLNSLLKKSTNEFDELKCLLKKYFKTEENNRCSHIDKNVKFTATQQDVLSTNKKSKYSSCSSSNSNVSLTGRNIQNRKKTAKTPETRQTTDTDKKFKVIKIKQTSNSTKSTKFELSDISESNEMERNSSSSDTIRGKAVPVTKQNAAITPSNGKQGPSTCKKPCKPKVGVRGDKQTELILKVFSKSTSSLLSSEDEDKRNYIQDFIDKAPMNSNDLTNPPNTVRLPSPDENANQNSVGSKRSFEKKINLKVQILPPLDIKRSLITQKLPDVEIEPIDDKVVDDSNKMPSENVKYIQMMHGHRGHRDLPKEQPSGEAKYNPDKNVSTHSDKKTTCTLFSNKACSCPTNTDIKELYIKPQQFVSSNKDINNEMPSTSNKNIKDVLKERGTVCEELNLDIDNLPSVRTLKEIQNYLEQKCTLIRSRLEEESKLKTGGTLSLRYKLSQPPLWQCSNSKAEPESEKQIPKAITCSPLKTYSSIKSPLSPLQKHDKSQQINSTLVCNANSKLLKSPVKTDNKSLQVSISEITEMPIARKEDTYSSPQFSIETSNKNIDETKESFKTPSLTSPKTAKCLENPKLVSFENQNQGTDINRLTEISTQTNTYSCVKQGALEIVTKQCFFIPNENKETQTSQVNVVDEMTNTPIEEKKKNNTAVKKTQTINNEARIKVVATCGLQSNSTQTVDVKDECTICNIQSIDEKAEKPQITFAAVVKDTKECCTQYSSVLELEFEAPQYKHKNSCRKVDRPKDLEERQYCDKSKMRNRRTMPRHKMCSTPVSPPSSISTAETVSLSDGEVKLSCECSTSIGEIHLCRFANNIRKKVRILKRNPRKVLNESFGLGNLTLKRQHKYNDNWFAYYVTKTETSSEHATGSNLSSIKSNIETE